MKDRLPEIIYYVVASIVLGAFVYIYKEYQSSKVLLGLVFYIVILFFMIADLIRVYRKEVLPDFTWKNKNERRAFIKWSLFGSALSPYFLGVVLGPFAVIVGLIWSLFR